MIGTPNKLEVRVSRKLSDGEYGSMEISASLEVNLGPNDNPENAFDGADLWLTAKIAKSLAEKQAEAKHGQVVAPKTTEVVAQAAQAQPAAVVAGPVAAGVAPEPTRVPVDDNGTEFEDVEVKDFVTETTKSGKLMAKVHGGKWLKFGVTAWPEVFEAIDIDLVTCALGVPYNLPGGYKRARVEMDGDKPKRVHHFMK